MAIRSLKRCLSNVVYARMVADQNRRERALRIGEMRVREGNGATSLTPA